MKTATIERQAVLGTPHHTLRLFYRGQDIGPAWIRDDVAGLRLCQDCARARGFDRVRYTGEWPGPAPRGHALKGDKNA